MFSCKSEVRPGGVRVCVGGVVFRRSDSPKLPALHSHITAQALSDKIRCPLVMRLSVAETRLRGVDAMCDCVIVCVIVCVCVWLFVCVRLLCTRVPVTVCACPLCDRGVPAFHLTSSLFRQLNLLFAVLFRSVLPVCMLLCSLAGVNSPRPSPPFFYTPPRCFHNDHNLLQTNTRI